MGGGAGIAIGGGSVRPPPEGVVTGAGLGPPVSNGVTPDGAIRLESTSKTGRKRRSRTVELLNIFDSGNLRTPDKHQRLRNFAMRRPKWSNGTETLARRRNSALGHSKVQTSIGEEWRGGQRSDYVIWPLLFFCRTESLSLTSFRRRMNFLAQRR